MKPHLDHLTRQQLATQGTPSLVLACQYLMPAERPRQAMFWAQPQRRRRRTGPSDRSRVERLARETSSTGGRWGSSPALASVVAAVLVGEAASGWGTAVAEHDWEVFSQGQEGRVLVRAVAQAACRLGVIKSNRVI